MFPAAVLALVSFASICVAGPLDPPAGPISPTNKTLAQVEPRTPISAATTPGDADSTFRISQSGSYYLTGNVAGENAKRGIEIAASDVSIDLSGFTMTGGAGSLAAIQTSTNSINIIVRNGTISAWPGGGVVLNSGRNCLVSDVAVNSCSGVSINVLFTSVIRNCVVDDSIGAAAATVGIQAQCCTVIESCRVGSTQLGTTEGIVVGDTCVVRGCSVNNMGGNGIRATSSGNIIENCTVAFCNANGVQVGGSSTVRFCSVNSTASGILANSGDNRIERNNVRNNVRGVHVSGPGNIIFGNTASGNTTANFDIATGNVGHFVTAATITGFAGSAGGVSPGSTDSNTNYSY